MPTHPSPQQLVDLFNWASPGMIVTDADGRVVLANKAAKELLADGSAAGSRLVDTLGVDDYAALLAARSVVENRAVRFRDTTFPEGFANLGFGQVDGASYGFWALRPVTTHPAPSDKASPQEPTTAKAWIARVDAHDAAYTPVTEQDVALLRGYYDHCPVAIHLIEEDGTVAHANWKDIAIVGATQAPDTYVGHHIRHIYADKEIVEDFLGRWDEDAPIIDFRADFLNSDKRVPVVIFSTANVENGTLKNTRCFVFPDNEPTRQRDRVTPLELSF
ncbi:MULTISPECIES: PAS domain-containing protein [unclassified Streptomyces]|uniref:PAS domain-containing protein n=1 Tax=unclassified Streptomyces TaxID=2593676 RepID=UPI00278C113C|nr:MULTISPECIES: PAS domain-containing protein [unclassified Streptomyces]